MKEYKILCFSEWAEHQREIEAFGKTPYSNSKIDMRDYPKIEEEINKYANMGYKIIHTKIEVGFMIFLLEKEK